MTSPTRNSDSVRQQSSSHRVPRRMLVALAGLSACLAAGATVVGAMAVADDSPSAQPNRAPLPAHIRDLEAAATPDPLPAHLRALEAAASRNSDFGAKMNSICVENGRQFDAIGEPETPDEIATMTPRLIAVFDESIDRIERLDAGDDSDTHQRFVALGRQQSDLLGRWQAAVVASDGATLDEVIAEMGAVATESNGLAVELGAPDCAG